MYAEENEDRVSYLDDSENYLQLFGSKMSLASNSVPKSGLV